MLRLSSSCSLHCRSKPIRRPAAGQGSDIPVALCMNQRYKMASRCNALSKKMQRRFPSLTRWQQFTSQALPRLRELVRRFHIKLKEDNTCNPSKAPELEAYTALCLSVRALSFQQVQPGRDPCAGRLHQKAKLRSSGLWHFGASLQRSAGSFFAFRVVLARAARSTALRSD